MDTSYDFTLVALSYAISVLGSFTALRLAIRIPSLKKEELLPWLVAAAAALGGGAVWSMHFIAMLAYKMPMPVSYDATMTVLSALVAILVCGIGLYLVGRGDGQPLRLAAAALLTGLGVAGMHYTGMAAMQMAADIQYDTTIVALSLVIAVVAAGAALWLAFNLRGNWQRLGSALVMGAAVSGMHYTGMAAVTLVPNAEKAVPVGGISSMGLALIVFAITGVLLAGGLIAASKPVKHQELVFDI